MSTSNGQESLGRDSPTPTGRPKSGFGFVVKKALASPFASFKNHVLRRPKAAQPATGFDVEVPSDSFAVPTLAAAKPNEASEMEPRVALSSSGSLSSIELTPFVAHGGHLAAPLLDSPLTNSSSSSLTSSPSASTTQSPPSLAPTVSSATCSLSSLSSGLTSKGSDEEAGKPAKSSSSTLTSVVSAVPAFAKGGSPRTTTGSSDGVSAQATLSSFSSSDPNRGGPIFGPALSLSLSESESTATPPSSRLVFGPSINEAFNGAISTPLPSSPRPVYLPPWSSFTMSPTSDHDALGVLEEAETAPFDEEDEESQLTEVFLKNDDDDQSPSAHEVLPSLVAGASPRSPDASPLAYFCNFFSTAGRILSFGGADGNLVSSPGQLEHKTKES